jgi:hypothetical protein
MADMSEVSEQPADPNLSRGDRISSVGGLLSLWFGLSKEVGRLPYALSGFGLMAFKYLVEAGVIYYFTQRFFTPTDFVNPLLSIRQQYLAAPAPEWLSWAIFLWSFPFLWIAVSMSVRRAVNAGATAWLGLMVIVPVANLVIMLILAFLPSRGKSLVVQSRPEPVVDQYISSALLGIVASVVICLIMLSISVYFFRDYGLTLFMGTPILMGAASAYIFNRPRVRTLGSSLLVAQLAILISGMTLLIFAFEGILCLAMLYPFAMLMGLLGGLIGFSVAAIAPQKAVTLVVPALLLPLLSGAEQAYRVVPEYEVISVVEIDATPERVWPHVIGFSELPPPPNWYFQLGIAYPQRATIYGTGVGAVRHCEFSTGPFVEPITVWDEPRRLAFDVKSQPPPMHELSPYRHVHPPHLDGYLRCQRGEFRLIELPGGRTRLEGSTWYEYEIFPQDYWTLWSDLLIHRIHKRVLDHIKNLAEADQAKQTVKLSSK